MGHAWCEQSHRRRNKETDRLPSLFPRIADGRGALLPVSLLATLLLVQIPLLLARCALFHKIYTATKAECAVLGKLGQPSGLKIKWLSPPFTTYSPPATAVETSQLLASGFLGERSLPNLR